MHTVSPRSLDNNRANCGYSPGYGCTSARAPQTAQATPAALSRAPPPHPRRPPPPPHPSTAKTPALAPTPAAPTPKPPTSGSPSSPTWCRTLGRHRRPRPRLADPLPRYRQHPRHRQRPPRRRLQLVHIRHPRHPRRRRPFGHRLPRRPRPRPHQPLPRRQSPPPACPPYHKARPLTTAQLAQLFAYLAAHAHTLTGARNHALLLTYFSPPAAATPSWPCAWPTSALPAPNPTPSSGTGPVQAASRTPSRFPPAPVTPSSTTSPSLAATWAIPIPADDYLWPPLITTAAQPRQRSLPPPPRTHISPQNALRILQTSLRRAGLPNSRLVAFATYATASPVSITAISKRCADSSTTRPLHHRRLRGRAPRPHRRLLRRCLAVPHAEQIGRSK